MQLAIIKLPRPMSTTAAVLQPEPQPIFAPSLKTGTFALVLFCAGHFLIDLYSSALGVLQPLLVAQFGLRFTQAGLLGGLLSFSSSVTQPVYGFLSDRFHSKLFTALAPAVAGAFISSLGWAPSYPVLLTMVFLGGAAIASRHPQATSNATVGVTRSRTSYRCFHQLRHPRDGSRPYLLLTRDRRVRRCRARSSGHVSSRYVGLLQPIRIEHLLQTSR